VRRVLVFAVLAVACRAPRDSAKPARELGAIAVGTERFPHALHTGDRPELRNWRGRGVACADCHLPAAVREGKLARPGLDNHAPCDECHHAEFGKPPGKLCRVCHVKVDPLVRGASPLGEYPKHSALSTLGSEFSHQLHLDAGRVGETIPCTSCHERDAKSRDLMRPGHAGCVRCHEGKPAVKAALGMDSCNRCHPPRDRVLPRCMILPGAEIVFHHATHERERGTAIRCETCHSDAAASRSRSDMMIPAMERCAQCHEDARRTQVLMSNCRGCHLEIDDSSPPSSEAITPVCFSDDEPRR
jgi:hypothetical protein